MVLNLVLVFGELLHKANVTTVTIGWWRCGVTPSAPPPPLPSGPRVSNSTHGWISRSPPGDPRAPQDVGCNRRVRYEGVAHPWQSIRPQREQIGTGCVDRATA